MKRIMAKKHRQTPARDKKEPSREIREGGRAAAAVPPDFTGAVDGGKSHFFWIPALLLVLSGYVLLKRVDPGGQNTWAIVSPALLLAGYLLFIPAILSRYPRKD